MPEQNKSIKVLLVEDNPFDAKAVEGLFGSISNPTFSLRQADTLAKAVAAYREERADVILLDLNLPDSFGPETLHKVQRAARNCPIIVLTGFYEQHMGPLIIKKGAQDYMVKGKITAEGLNYSIRFAIERERIERRMREREARLRDLLEKIPEGFLVVNRASTPVFVNRSAENIFGLPRAELVATPLPMEIIGEGSTETELLRRDGRKVPVEIHGVQIQWGKEDCRLVMIRDMTQAKLLERARNDFISMASHELRGPLTIVQESLALVCDGTTGDISEQQREILKMGLDNTGRLNRLIDALLDITKIEAGVMPMYIAEADLASILRETCAEHSRLAAEKGAELAAEVPPTPVLCYCDGDKIRQVLMNLLSNAIKFTPTGGRIDLSLRLSGGDALFGVTNTGQGIDAEDLPKIFNKFGKFGGSSGSEIKGTGLGLAISRGIVEMHNGSIWAESEAGKNCSFFMRLPRLSFAEATKHLVRREIEFSRGKRPICTLTALLPASEVPNAVNFIKARFRSSNAMLIGKEGDITILIQNSGIKECAKASFLMGEGLREITGSQDKPVPITALLYPEDFRDQDEFWQKISQIRGEK
ncbi:MAG: hypothetical protein CVU79_05470 [Elusimicrobia bacterium HGW-Elusimicrobia-3]|nr:MAG: hypothetical protein CVU79_05470 [Elusimicrobia bacterium HGW-Elusimicrobia-3]